MENRAEKRRRAVKAFMDARGLKILPWATRAGISEGALRNFLRGRSDSLRHDIAEALAESEGVTPAYMFGEEMPRKVSVINYIGAGARVLPIDDYAQGSGMYEIDTPPGEDPETLVALEIRGNSMFPLKDGWVIMYRRRSEGIDDGALNELCAIATEDGAVYIKTLRVGYEPGTYNLESWNAEPILNVRVRWASKIRWIYTK